MSPQVSPLSHLSAQPEEVPTDKAILRIEASADEGRVSVGMAVPGRDTPACARSIAGTVISTVGPFLTMHAGGLPTIMTACIAGGQVVAGVTIVIWRDRRRCVG